MVSANLSTNHIAVELHSAMVANAETDAVRLADFLNRLGLGPAEVPSRRLPKDFLLAMAAVLRLRDWEAKDLWLHVESGMPSAQHAFVELREALLQAHIAKVQKCAALMTELVGLFAERLAWNAQQDLGADLQLSDVDDDSFINTLAEFLWEQRNSLSGG